MSSQTSKSRMPSSSRTQHQPVAGVFSSFAEKNRNPAFTLKLSSYLSGLAIGILNYSHFAQHWSPTPLAIVTGSMSTVSPHLWAMYAHRKSAPVAIPVLRLGRSRWLWHPVRSVQVKYAATWSGEADIVAAIETYAKNAESKRTDRQMGKS